MNNFYIIVMTILVCVLALQSSPYTLTKSMSTSEEYGYHVVQSYDRDDSLFTQGFLYYRMNASDPGVFYESAGLYRRSQLTKVDLFNSITPLQTFHLEDKYFAEGITLLNDKIYQLTWKEGVVFVYDRATLGLIETLINPVSEGWGLTTYNDILILTDGTSNLYHIDPIDFSIITTIVVKDGESKVSKLNEIEMIKGKVWTNIWYSNLVAIIDPQTGQIDQYINLNGLKTTGDVLNGIAYDEICERVYVTGKQWPKMYDIIIDAENAIPDWMPIRKDDTECYGNLIPITSSWIVPSEQESEVTSHSEDLIVNSAGFYRFYAILILILIN